MSAREAVERLLGVPVTGVRRSSGAVCLVTTERRGVLVVKQGTGPGATDAEAAGLRWLGEHGDVPVPNVHAHDDEWIVMDYVPPTYPEPAAAEAFGRGLACLHRRGASAYGTPPPGGPANAWMGLAPMRNEPRADWAVFYAEHRVLPYVEMCVDQGLYDAEQAAVFERLCSRLPELGGPPEPPSRVHGDAWSGNVHWAQGAVWLIDPAAHGGHRETDLAMLHLFGTPLLDRIVGAYEEAAKDLDAPLADGWRDRMDLHQLFPLLMHAAVFGAGYARQALRAAQTALH